MGFNSAFKGLTCFETAFHWRSRVSEEFSCARHKYLTFVIGISELGQSWSYRRSQRGMSYFSVLNIGILFYVFLHAYLFLSALFQHLPPHSSTLHWEQNQFRQHCVRECDPMYKVRKHEIPACARFEDFTAVLLNIQFFRDVTTCPTGLLDPEYEGSSIFRNICNFFYVETRRIIRRYFDFRGLR